MSHPDPASNKRDDQLVFNTRLIHPLLKYYSQRYGRQELEALVADLGEELSSLNASDAWISANLVRNLSLRMVERSGNPRLTYEAGMDLLDPKIMGASYWAVRAMGDPGKTYEQLCDLNLPLSRITRWETVEVGRSHAILRFHVSRGHVDDPLFCLNRQGALAGIPKGLGFPPARVSHPRCIHEGHPFCEYHVKWDPPEPGRRLITATTVLAGLSLLGGWFWGWLPPAALMGIPFLVIALLLYLLWVRGRRYKLVLDALVHLHSDKTIEHEQEHRRFREMASLRGLDQKLRQELNVTALVETALKEITTTLSYERAAYLHRDRGRRTYRVVRAEGFSGEQEKAVRRMEIPFPTGQGLLAGALQSRRALLMSRVEDADLEATGLAAVVRALESRDFLVVPMATTEEVLGLLVVDQTSAERTLQQHDADFVEQLCNLVSLALANARLVEDLRREHRNLQTALLINQKYSQYLPAPVVERLRRDPDSAGKLGGTPVSATVMFTDIVGFTPWSEARSPMEVITALNRYFAEMDQIIVATGGILDKRMGDGLMVVYLHPEGVNTDLDVDIDGLSDDSAATPVVRHPAWRALECGIEMQRRLTDIRCRDDSLADFHIRIGIAHGVLVAGNIGSPYRIEYTVIGDVVNLASRLSDLADSGTILTTRRVLQAANFFYQATPVGRIQVKGRAELVDAFRVDGTGVRYKAASVEPESP